MTSIITALTAHMHQSTDHHLHNIRIIVDGYNLLTYLAHQQKRPHGQYEALSESCHAFFTNLQTCQIWPFVIFSGACGDSDPGDTKRHVAGHQRRIGLARRAALGDYSCHITPVLAMEVLKDKLNCLGIPFATCGHKQSINEITGLANTWVCPVLGSNPYYHTMDIKAGFIPLEGLQWQQVNDEGAVRSLVCRRYLLSKFCKAYKFDGSLVPLLITMLEDDYLSIVKLSSSWNSTLNGRHTGTQSATHKNRLTLTKTATHPNRHTTTQSPIRDHVNDVLKWLAKAQSLKTPPMAKLLSCLETDKQIKVQHTVAAHTKMLKPSDASHLVAYFTAKTSTTSTWYYSAFREGKLPNTVMNVIHTQQVFNPVQVEDHNLPSSNDISLPLRQILYGILLPYDQQTCPDATVTEYDRNGSGVSCNQVSPTYHVKNFGRVLKVFQIPGICVTTKKRFLMASLSVPSGMLGPMLASIPNRFHFIICIVIYWKFNSWLVNANHVRALLVTWILGVAKRKMNQQSKMDNSNQQYSLDDWPSSEFTGLVHHFTTHIEPTFPPDSTSHMDAIHCFAQLQSCMKAAFHINDVLQQVHPIPDVSMLFNGRLIHGMYAILKDIPSDMQDVWIGNHLFPHSPTALALYSCLEGYINMHTRCTDWYEEIY